MQYSFEILFEEKNELCQFWFGYSFDVWSISLGGGGGGEKGPKRVSHWGGGGGGGLSDVLVYMQWHPSIYL